MGAIVVAGSASTALGGALAAALNVPSATVESRRFPDGEAYVRIHDDLAGKEVIVIQSTFPDPSIVELLILLDAVREFPITSVTTVIPYFAYSRQDKVFEKGEAISARALARAIAAHSDRFVSVDLHTTSILKWFDIPASHVTAMRDFGHYFHKEGRIDLVMAPDKGAVDRARVTAEIIGCDWDHLEKTRIDATTVRITPKQLDVRGRHVLLVDDVISTGGTILKATESLRGQGAASVTAACTHGLFAQGALDRLRSTLDGVVATDTIENAVSRISVGATLAQHLRQQ